MNDEDIQSLIEMSSEVSMTELAAEWSIITTPFHRMLNELIVLMEQATDYLLEENYDKLFDSSEVIKAKVREIEDYTASVEPPNQKAFLPVHTTLQAATSQVSAAMALFCTGCRRVEASINPDASKAMMKHGAMMLKGTVMRQDAIDTLMRGDIFSALRQLQEAEEFIEKVRGELLERLEELEKKNGPKKKSVWTTS